MRSRLWSQYVFLSLIVVCACVFSPLSFADSEQETSTGSVLSDSDESLETIPDNYEVAIPIPEEIAKAPKAVEAITKAIQSKVSEKAFDWNGYSKKAALLEEVESRAKLAYEFIEAATKEIDPKEFDDRVEADKVKFNLESFGRLDITHIDKQKSPRFIHDETGISVFPLYSSRIKKDSKHLRKIIRRQHIDAGEQRPDKSKPGRDTMIVWLDDDGKIESYQYYPRHPFASTAYWEDYFLSGIEASTLAETVFGTICAGFQMGLAGGVAAFKSWLNPGASIDLSGLYASAPWGFTIGTQNRTYRNLVVNRGSERSRATKMWVQSMLFAMTVFAIQQGVGVLFDYNSPDFWNNYLNALTTTYLHNQGRRAWYLIVEMRLASRDVRGNFHIMGKDTGIKNASVEQQMIYLIPYTIRLAGLVGVGALAQVALSEDITYKFDGGTLGVLLSIPVAQQLALAYSRLKKHENSDLYAQEFYDYWTKWPLRIVRGAGYVATKVSQAARSCANLLLSPDDIPPQVDEQ